MEIKTAIKALEEYQLKLYAYAYATSSIYIDSVTVAPSDTAKGRGQALGVLSAAQYDLTVDPEAEKMLRFLSKHLDELNTRQAKEVTELLRGFDRMKKIPKDEFVAYEMLINEAEDAWHRAKLANDFPMFAPYLEKIVETLRRFAKYYEPEKDPYDVWLGEYERGLTREKADVFFAELRKKIVPLLKKVQAQDAVKDDFMNAKFPIEQQKKLSAWAMNVMKIDPTHCVLGETEHPFTAELDKENVRITTHYHEDNFISSLFSVVHEGGHALYELGMGDDLWFSSLSHGVSMGMHESQSRLYENIIGRSEAFCEILLPEIQKLVPGVFDELTVRELYRAVNKAEPSLIRTEADELTYSLHIMVRYEIEKKLMSGELAVKDLPVAWNRLYEEYLGITPPTDTEGVLQDSHWSGGAIGYFPSYALGSAYGAQIIARLKEDVDVDAAVRAGDFSPIVNWLTEKMYCFGSIYDPEELFLKICGKPFDPTYFTDYLEKKYADIYGF